MEEALLGDDAADQERDEQDDRHRLPADPVEMMHGRREAEGLRPPQHGDERLPERTQHVHEHDQIVPEIGNAAAEALERGEQSVLGAWRCLGLAVGSVHPFEQATVALRQLAHAQVLSAVCPRAGQALQQPRAVGVELGHAAHVDGGGARLRGLAGRAVDQRLEVAGMAGGPRAACGELQPPVADRGAQCRLAAQCFLRAGVGRPGGLRGEIGLTSHCRRENTIDLSQASRLSLLQLSGFEVRQTRSGQNVLFIVRREEHARPCG